MTYDICYNKDMMIGISKRILSSSSPFTGREICARQNVQFDRPPFSFSKNIKIFQKGVDKPRKTCYNNACVKSLD